MAHQAPISGQHGDGSVPEGMVGSLAELGTDVANLAELQLQLATIDARESARRAIIPTVLIVVVLAVALGCVPVALIGVAELLVASLAWSPGVALIVTAVVALVLSLGVGALAVWWLSRSFTSFRRSREELVRNIAWIRAVMIHSGRTVPRRQF